MAGRAAPGPVGSRCDVQAVRRKPRLESGDFSSGQRPLPVLSSNTGRLVSWQQIVSVCVCEKPVQGEGGWVWTCQPSICHFVCDSGSSSFKDLPSILFLSSSTFPPPFLPESTLTIYAPMCVS